ncbi:MAG TPA: hypothetical protein VLV88_14865 [Terriglobales bacterium]|nr:hypothetical protein [Terriglobales bacterium]
MQFWVAATLLFLAVGGFLIYDAVEHPLNAEALGLLGGAVCCSIAFTMVYFLGKSEQQ